MHVHASTGLLSLVRKRSYVAHRHCVAHPMKSLTLESASTRETKRVDAIIRRCTNTILRMEIRSYVQVSFTLWISCTHCWSKILFPCWDVCLYAISGFRLSHLYTNTAIIKVKSFLWLLTLSHLSLPAGSWSIRWPKEVCGTSDGCPHQRKM